MAHYQINFRSRIGKVKSEEITPRRLFHSFIVQYVSTLVERGLIQEREMYKSHITPRYDDKPQYGREIVYMETSERSWLEHESRAGWRSESQIDGMPMRYFTLTLCTSPRGFVYKKDFPLTSLDETIIEWNGGMNNNFGSGSAQSVQQEWQWDIIAVGQDQAAALDSPFYSQASDPVSVLILISPTYSSSEEELSMGEPLPIALESIDENEEKLLSQEPLEILVESVAIDLPTRPLPDPRQIQGVKVSSEGMIILVARPILESITKESVNRSEDELSGGGLLIGDVFHEEKSGELVTYITDYLSASIVGAKKGLFWLSNAETWDAMLQQKDQKYTDKMVVGWFRDHLLGTWLSSNDEFIHTNFFRERWQVALMLDRIRGVRRFYQWKGDSLVPTSSFQIIG